MSVRVSRSGGVLLVMRVPFLDRIESLLYLVEYLARRGHKVTIVSPADDRFPAPSFSTALVEHVKVMSTSRSWLGIRVPTAVRLMLATWRHAFRVRPAVVMASDQLAEIIAYPVAALLGLPYVYYSLEFPEPRTGRQTLRGRLERATIRRAAIGVTFDRDHADFIAAETGLPKDRLLLLPNSFGPRSMAPQPGSYLAQKHDLPSGAVVVLHAGGFGPWFSCRELASAARDWPEGWRLVFHASHSLTEDPYLENARPLLDGHKVILDTEPVGAGEVDALVASATVGVALYSRNLLGFRAELMGQASGKIGRCLKNGIPVVAQDVPSIRRYVEAYGCGECVNTPGEVQGAVSRILKDYERYRANALRCYDDLWSPEPYCAQIVSRLEELAHWSSAPAVQPEESHEAGRPGERP